MSTKIDVAKRTFNAKLRFFDAMLQRVKEEERLRVASRTPGHRSGYLLSKTTWKKSSNDESLNDMSNLGSLDSPIRKDIPHLRFESVKKDSLELSKENNTKKSDSRLVLTQEAVIPKPGTDAAKTEICLDNLTIRELHEAFRTTFGRETSVKDKQWLKRRISMGLRDFHEVANNNIVLENNASGSRKQEERSSRHAKIPSAEQPVPHSSNVQVTADGTAELVGRKHHHDTASSLIPVTDTTEKMEYEMSNDEFQAAEETAGKRVRKPTRRYIEESAEVELRVSTGRLVPAVRDSDDDYSPPMSRFRSSYWNGFEGMELASRHDSLEGSGAQVPFVPRARRGRPRKNSSALPVCRSIQYNSSGRAAKLVKKALCVRSDGDNTETKDKPRILFLSNQRQNVHDVQDNEDQTILPISTERHCPSEPLNIHSLDENLNERVATVPTAKGGIRRKHHRPWTLRDVMKLVEGVSHCGVGKWADIKRVAFSLSAYRTSVDLKDKWRNLLRASYSQLQTCKERWIKYDRHRLAFRERHCPPLSERIECLIPPPKGYKIPIRWPKSRNECWYRNVPYDWINNVKSNQNWLKKEGEKFLFPGGGTMFPRGVNKYLDLMEELIPGMKDGSVRTSLDTGCGVASWGGYLLDRRIITLSVAPRDNHEAQVQFALERGIPAMLGIISTQRLPYPSNAFDMVHCSRCLIPWTEFGGVYLLEIDRVLRRGGFWVLSGPPVNYENRWHGWNTTIEEQKASFDALQNLLTNMCYKLYNKKDDIAVWQKALDSNCYDSRDKTVYPPKCDDSIEPDAAW